MLVEDDSTVREFARRGLTRLGYTVLEAGSAEAAVSIIDEKATSIDLLITDVIMPGMPGPELAQIVHTSHPELKVVFMSGYTENALDQSDLVDGRAHFIEKPLSMKRLGQLVREILDA